jgi:hypothetical protein
VGGNGVKVRVASGARVAVAAAVVRAVAEGTETVSRAGPAEHAVKASQSSWVASIVFHTGKL